MQRVRPRLYRCGAANGISQLTALDVCSPQTTTSADIRDLNSAISLVRRVVCLCPWVKTVVVNGDCKSLFVEATQATANDPISPKVSCSVLWERQLTGGFRASPRDGTRSS